MTHKPKIPRAVLEAAAKAAHEFARFYGVRYASSHLTWASANREIKLSRRALARAVLKAAGVGR